MQMQNKHLYLFLAVPLLLASTSLAHAAVVGNDPTNQPLAVQDNSPMPADICPDGEPNIGSCDTPGPLELAEQENAQEAEDGAETAQSAEEITVDLDNFVEETLQIIDVARIKRETAPPPLTVVQQRQKDLEDDNHPFTPEGFLNAAKEGNEKLLLRYLEADMKPNAQVSSGQSALHFAVIGNRLDIAQMLLSYGANPDIQNTRGDTPLHLAVERNKPYMVALLTTEGANTNQANRDGWNPLHLAAYNNYAEVAALLLEKGAKLNQLNRVGMTPLMITVWKGYDALAVYFIEHGADITPRDPQGNNAFLLAVTHNRPALVKLFLEKDSDPNDMNGRGWSAIDIALESQYPQIANMLYAAGAKAPGLSRTQGAILNADR